jgi:hypothetical protein
MEGRERPWISVFFECCRVYLRIYLNRSGKAFVGWCPKCKARIEVGAGPEGSPERFFSAR